MYRFIKILIVSALMPGCFAAQLREIDLDTAWEEGRFSGISLWDVTSLRRGNRSLDTQQKDCLANSKTLTSLESLDLSQQDIDDDYVRQICNNPVFNRLARIDLSGNKGVSEASLQAIAGSKVGSLRCIPQISARYDVPSSEIHVMVSGTGITPEIAEKYNAKPQVPEFIIFYYHPVTGKKTAPYACDAIKWVQVKP